jgi:hypothetical protein
MAESEGVPAGFVRVGPLRPRRDAMEFLARAHVLVSLPQDSDLAIPSKIFEYTQFPAWLLVLATRESAVERLLRDTPADVVEPDDVDGMERVLSRRYEEFARGEAPRPIDPDGRFSRARQAARFFEYLDAAIAAEGARSGGRV